MLTVLLQQGDQTKGDSTDSSSTDDKDTKENITPKLYITRADVSPSHKWHPSHFSWRCVNDVCRHPS